VTSYSVTNRFVDDPQVQREADCDTFMYGACRALLDEADAEEQPHPEIETVTTEAVWWHIDRLGWELDAITSEGSIDVPEFLTTWAEANHDELAELDWAYAPARDLEAYPWYRAGYLFIHSVMGSGIGLWECGEAGKRLHESLYMAVFFEAWELGNKVHVQFSTRSKEN
jgi:hypothetical protein